MLRRGSDYRDNNIETKRDRHRLYNINHKKKWKNKHREYQYLENFCPACLYIVKLY